MALLTDLTEAADDVIELAPATNGEIAVINLKSALQASWNRFWRDPQRAASPNTSSSRSSRRHSIWVTWMRSAASRLW